LGRSALGLHLQLPGDLQLPWKHFQPREDHYEAQGAAL
jgi:hypothetical protein